LNSLTETTTEHIVETEYDTAKRPRNGFITTFAQHQSRFDEIDEMAGAAL
jgi:hypothetical protein